MTLLRCCHIDGSPPTPSPDRFTSRWDHRPLTSVSPETTKLSDLRAGDKVRIRMTREAVIVPVGSSAQNAQDDIATAAEIVAVDRKTGVVGLKGSKGATFHIQVSDASQTLNLASGMRVQVNYSATATVSVAAAQ
jgi:hypothetical protein